MNSDDHEALAQVATSMSAGIASAMRELGRRSLVVGVSGGIDSALSLVLATKAIGANSVRAVAMPEKENSPESLELAIELCKAFDVQLETVDLTASLTAAGCYERRDSAVRAAVPDFDPDLDSVAVSAVQDIRGSRLPASYQIRVYGPARPDRIVRLRRGVYDELFSASNLKQRMRTLTLYDFADRYRAAVLGTSNLDETYLGFFVRLGDGSWDICPLDGATTTTILALSESVGVPRSIRERTTTTDTFPNAGQSQQDMFYGLPFSELDVLLEVLVGRRTRMEALDELGWPENEVDNALHNLKRRNRSTTWNRAAPISIRSHE
jgi:NAD+ synthase